MLDCHARQKVPSYLINHDITSKPTSILFLSVKVKIDHMFTLHVLKESENPLKFNSLNFDVFEGNRMYDNMI